MQQKVQETKLDAIDKKILLALMQDSRTPKTTLAKQLKISTQRLEYKLKRLYSTIIQPAIILNYKLLNIQEYIIFTKRLDAKTIQKLKQSKNIFFLAEFVGKYKYLIYIQTPDISQFKKEYLSDQIVETYEPTNFLTDTYNPFGIKLKPTPQAQTQQINLTKQDYKILYHLYQNPLENYINLATKTSLDWRTVKTRMEKMLSAKIIDRFKISYNTFKMNHLTYFIKIKTPENYKQKIKETAQKNNFSGFLWETQDYILMIYMPPTHEELLEFTSEIESIHDKIETDINQIVNYEVQTKPESILNELGKRCV